MNPLEQHAHRIWSQNGEDGAIAYILDRIGIEREFFVEIGAGDYSESNTARLAYELGWSGLVIEANDDLVAAARHDCKYWQSHVRLVEQPAQPDTINFLLHRHGVVDPVDLLSIDIDGQDFWLWKAIELRPRLVVVEYNWRFGPFHAVTMPPSAYWMWNGVTQAYGASLQALVRLGQEKGYTFVGTVADVNAFFVRDDLAGDMGIMPVSGWVRTPEPVPGWDQGRFLINPWTGQRVDMVEACAW